MDMQKELDKVFEDYMKERNFIPDYAKILAEENPEFLVKWFETRRSFRGQGVLPEKFKELLLLACAAGRLYETSCDMHAETAIYNGATKQEVLETALCTWLVGGMPSLILCLNALEKALKKAK
jgi:alkylhydroperoxidase/carboxymuconolactone decarboxylase family protein YurZ